MRLSIRGACGGFRAASQLGHPLAQLRTQPSTTLAAARRSHGGYVARRQWGGIMDRVERSFAAATAAGLVVLIIGIARLALM